MQFLNTIPSDPALDDYATYPDDYSTYATSPEVTAAQMQAMTTSFLFLSVAFLVQYILFSWALGKVFKKAGVEGWKAWVPIYNYAVMLKLGGYSPWFAALLLVPVAGVVAAVFIYISMHRIGKGFGHGGGMTALAIFFPFVWSLIIGLGSSQWREQRAFA
jgi:hypothetical protein